MATNTYGHAGRSLSDGSFTVDSFVGRGAADTERRTAAILDSHTRPGGPVALHDLDIPKRMPDGRRPNIDHILLVGKTIWVVDSKWWKPGFYWTIGGRTFRGTTRFAAADKQTLAMACDALAAHLAGLGITGVQVKAVAVVWPSSTKGSLHTWAASMPGAALMPASRLQHWAAARTRHATHADPHVLVALTQLLKP